MQLAPYQNNKSFWQPQMDALKAIIKNSGRILAAVLTAMSCASRQAEAQSDDPNLVVDHPFVTQASHDNLRNCIKDITQTELDNLSLIQKISYAFDPLLGGDGSPGKPDVNISRYMQFSIPEVGQSAVARTLSSFNSNSCETVVRNLVPERCNTQPSPHSGWLSF